MSYLMDTNIFIESKNSFYAFDLCPGFWHWLENTTDVKSITMVREEIFAGKDELTDWVKSHLAEDFFLQEDFEIQQQYKKITAHVMDMANFSFGLKTSFLDVADGWLIAAAMARNEVIITHEKFEPKCRSKILLPVVAHHFNVKCISIFDALRELKVRFQ